MYKHGWTTSGITEAVDQVHPSVSRPWRRTAINRFPKAFVSLPIPNIHRIEHT